METRCSKCGVNLEQGSLIHLSHAWTPNKTKWGTNITGTMKKNVENEKEVVAYRCPKCDKLELYTNPL